MKICSFLNACVSLVFVAVISGQANAADTVALVSDVSGNVMVKTNGGSSPAKLLAAIPLGARFDLPAGAKLSMIYVAKGDEYRLSGPGSYQVEASSPQTLSGNAPAKQASIGGALSGKKIRPENVAQATLTMRGSKKVRHSLGPLTPSGSITLADPLQLHWREPTDELTYQIQLIDSQNNVLVSKEITGNTFILPREIPLVSGGYYIWNITTTMPDGSLVTSSAQFKTASKETREQAANLRPKKGGPVAERVAYGLWLEAENLAYEAHRVWVELAAEFPDQPNLRDRVDLRNVDPAWLVHDLPKEATW